MLKNRRGYYIGLDLLYNKNNYGNMCLGTAYNGELNDKCEHERSYAGRSSFGKARPKNSLYGLKLLAGYKYNNYMGVEFFIQQSEEVDKRNSINVGPIVESIDSSSFSYRAIGLDYMGYYPINEYYELIGALGLGWYDFDVSANKELYNKTVGISHDLPSKIGQKNTFGIRAGLGTQFYINNNISAVLMGRYIKMINDDVIKDMLELSLGLRYNFY
jgi:opacity protein-like surface antigen